MSIHTGYNRNVDNHDPEGMNRMDQTKLVFNDLMEHTAKGNSSGAAAILCNHQDSLYYTLRSFTSIDRRRTRRVLNETREVLRKAPQSSGDTSTLEQISVVGSGRVALLKLSLRLRSDASFAIHEDIQEFDYALWRKIRAQCLIWTYTARRVYRPKMSR